MTKISVLFLLNFIFCNCGTAAKSLVDGMKNEREAEQNEIASREHLFENSNGFDENNGYSKMYDMSNYRTMFKRSLRERNPSQRQTGIIYGDGKPIGILQPYQESFKFMPIKEERVYSLDGGRSNINEQEPYINLMYPLARFTRSEDAIRMAELEAAKAEFLDKHYPSMLVDFKIHNKLHQTGYHSKSAPTFNIKREEAKPVSTDMRKKKRESQNPNLSSPKLHKRENKHVQNRDTSKNKKQTEQISTLQKREETKEIHKREEISTPSFQKQQTENEYANVEQNKLNKKRESKLTDLQFENLKKGVSKRNSNGNIQVIEEDLKGLLSDMGLIEDDLEENTGEMEENKRSVVQEDREEGFDTNKQKAEPEVGEKSDNPMSPERRKRAGGIKMNVRSRTASTETRNSALKKRTLDDSVNKRSVSDKIDPGKRFIEVSFSSKEDKEPISESDNEGPSSPKSSVIPNKREISKVRSLGLKRERSASMVTKTDLKRSEESAMSATESYEQYEQRVAREIKNKIQQLKEEVKRELGALESDREEEDEEETIGEPQRKKRFIMNTLMDEETHKIDPNENLDSVELEPHVRRRRTLSTDMTSAVEISHSNSYEGRQLQDVDLVNLDPKFAPNKLDFDIGGYYNVGRDKSFVNQELYKKDNMAKNNVLYSKGRTMRSQFSSNNARGRNYRQDKFPIYSKAAAKIYFPEYRRGRPGKSISDTSRRNLRNDAGSESEDYNDYESDDSNTDSEEADGPMTSVVDMTRKSPEKSSEDTQQSRKSTKHYPKKMHSYNHNYIYYYIGGKGNDNKEGMAPLVMNAQRKNQRQFPSQFYRMNRFQNRQYNGAKAKAFQRRFDNPFARRNKRFVNFMVPSHREDAVMMNAFIRNSSQSHPTFWLEARSGKSQHVPFERGAKEYDKHEDQQRNITGSPITEKENL